MQILNAHGQSTITRPGTLLFVEENQYITFYLSIKSCNESLYIIWLSIDKEHKLKLYKRKFL